MDKETLIKKIFPNGYIHTFVGISLKKDDPEKLALFLKEEKEYLLYKGNDEDEIIQALKYIQEEAEKKSSQEA